MSLGEHTSAPRAFTIAAHVGDADRLSRDGCESAGDADKLAAALAGSAVELDDRNFVLHSDASLSVLCHPGMSGCSKMKGCGSVGRLPSRFTGRFTGPREVFLSLPLSFWYSTVLQGRCTRVKSAADFFGLCPSCGRALCCEAELRRDVESGQR